MDHVDFSFGLISMSKLVEYDYSNIILYLRDHLNAKLLDRLFAHENSKKRIQGAQLTGYADFSFMLI